MPTYNHAFSFAFSVNSEDPEGKDVTAAALRAALLRRLYLLPDEEVLEACGCPWDRYELKTES